MDTVNGSGTFLGPEGNIVSWTIQDRLVTSVSYDTFDEIFTGPGPDDVEIVEQSVIEEYDTATGLPLVVRVTPVGEATQNVSWQEYYADDTRTITTVERVTDAGGAPWTSRATARDAEGDVVYSEQLGDDGVNFRRYVTPDGDTMTVSADTQDARPWILRQDDVITDGVGGVLETYSSVLQDDLLLTFREQDADGATTSQIFVDWGDRFEWASRVRADDIDGGTVFGTLFDDTTTILRRLDAEDVLLDIVKVRPDDDEVLLEFGADGALERRVLTDTLEQRAYASWTTEFLEGGAKRQIFDMDDGILIDRLFDANGTKREETFIDEGDVKPWSRIDREWDPEGNQIRNDVTLDPEAFLA